MADEATPEAAAETSGDSTTAPATEATPTEQQAVADGEAALGDAGKKALDAMKAERNQYRTDLSALRSEFEAFKAKAEGKEQEFAAAQEAQRLKDEAIALANDRILKAEIRAAASNKLADPQDALRFLNMSEFEVGSDGEVDASQIARAIDDLIASRPYLGAQGTARFQGSADGGARNDSKPASIDEQIAAAEKAGDWQTANGLKAQRLVEIRNSTQ